MTFTIQWKKNGVFITFKGIVQSQTLIDANNYLLSNADFDSLDYQIFDFSNIFSNKWRNCEDILLQNIFMLQKICEKIFDVTER